jgi:hypothetical protein
MIDRRLAATLVGGTALVAIVGGAAGAAHAATVVYPPTQATCTVGSTAPALGQTDSVSCTGATPGDSYEVLAHSKVVVLATATASSPSFTVSFTVGGVPAGPHHLEVIDTTTGVTLVSAAISVSPAVATTTTGSTGTTGTTGTTGSTGSSSGSLPFTGADVAAMSVAGVALIGAGGAAFVAGARRKRRTDA